MVLLELLHIVSYQKLLKEQDILYVLLIMEMEVALQEVKEEEPHLQLTCLYHKLGYEHINLDKVVAAGTGGAGGTI